MSEAPTRKFDPIALSSESTVVAEYVQEISQVEAYQSEAELEREMIHLLESQAYEYLSITSEAQLVANLRAQLEKLNKMTFSNVEWEQFFGQRVAGARWHRGENHPHPGGPRPAPYAGRRVDEECPTYRQGGHSQQPTSGDQPVPDRC